MIGKKNTIKIKFVDFWGGFDSKNNDFVSIISERYQVEFTDEPDYLFYSCFGYEHLKYDCIRIFYTGECITPNFNECDYAIGFDRLEFGDRYKRIPLYRLFQYKTEYAELFDRPIFTKENLRSKTGFCSFVYSNCFAMDLRTQIFEKLSAYKQVSSGGRYRNNIGGAVSDKKAFQSYHKFAIAFENSSYDGYCTEKLMEAFAAGTIPIYYGDPRVVEDFNVKAFINCHDYDSLEDVVDRIIEIDNDDNLYLSIRNASPLHNTTMITENGLAEFLYHILEQDYEKTYRRPFSAHPQKLEKAQLRHAVFETHIYGRYQKIKNILIRICTGTMLTNKRNK